MKLVKRLLLITCICFSLIQPIKVNAAGGSVSASTTSAEVGDSVTIYVSFSGAAWNITVSGTGISGGSYASQTSDLSEATTNDSFTLDTSAEGTYTITISGDVTDAEGNTKDVYDSVTVVVSKPASDNTGGSSNSGNSDSNSNTGSGSNTGSSSNSGNSSNTGSSTTTETETKSSDARLYSLSVDKGTLSPAFSSSTTTYTVELTSKDTEITITASAWDDEAEVSGAGLKPIQLGSNSFSIDVTAEDGTKKTYTVNVNVSEVPVTYLEFNGGQYGIMKEVPNGDIPKGFTESEATINDETVPVFVNEASTLTLVYAVNEEESKGFYLYTEEDGILGLYRPLFVNGKEVFIVSIPEELQTRESMAFATMSINGEELQAWTFEDEELVGYSLIYVMNDDGSLSYYLYDQTNDTLTIYPDSSPVTFDEFVKAGLIEEEPTNYGLYGGIAVGVLALVLVIFLVAKKKKKKEEKIEEPEIEEEINPIEETKVFTFDKEEMKLQEVHPIETDLEKIKEIDEEEIETKETPIIPVGEEDEDDDWLSDDFYKTILGDDE